MEDEIKQHRIYTDANNGDDTPCRFDTPELDFEERLHNLFTTSFTLTALQSFFSLPGAVPTINDADSILTRLYYSYKLNRVRQQPRLWMSDGTLRNYNKSTVTRLTHALNLPYRSRGELANLISFFAGACEGARNTFTWHLDGVAKTVRFADSTLSWTQDARFDETYDVTLNLEEDT